MTGVCIIVSVWIACQPLPEALSISTIPWFGGWG